MIDEKMIHWEYRNLANVWYVYQGVDVTVNAGRDPRGLVKGNGRVAFSSKRAADCGKSYMYSSWCNENAVGSVDCDAAAQFGKIS